MITKEAQETKKFEAQLGQFKKKPSYRPAKTVVMGDPGAGKTWFGLSAPKPFLINADDGAQEIMAQKGLEYSLDVIPGEGVDADASKWTAVGDTLKFLRDGDHPFRTVVVDSLDGIEKLAEAAVCHDKNVNSMEDFDYQKGYVFARGKLQKFLNMLTQVRDHKGAEIIVCAHTQIKDVHDPRVGTFSTHMLKLHTKAMGDVREWADSLLFLAFQHRKIVDKGKFNRSDTTVEQSSDTRYLITQGGRGVQCKNRYGLPNELYANDGEELYDAYQRQIKEQRK